jgi:hypothetical protein
LKFNILRWLTSLNEFDAHDDVTVGFW